MLDTVKLRVQAGRGGTGRVSFRREKFVPKGGPDGGQGGDGGDVVIEVDPTKYTLQHLAGVHEVVAKAGQDGGKRQQRGSKGEVQVIKVPVGTTVWLRGENQASFRRRHQFGLNWRLNRADHRLSKFYLEKEGSAVPPHPHPDQEVTVVDPPEVIADFFDSHAEPLLLAQGGVGGRGNESFKSSRQTTPLEAEFGSPGEIKEITLELQLLADVGLVGWPNAGKSSILSRLTKANPKIAAYPFTTLSPNLGVLTNFKPQDAPELIIADIPGLIEGAHSGKGLGDTFLKHIAHCQILVYVIAPTETEATELGVEPLAALLFGQYQQVRGEVAAYDQQLAARPSIVCLHKVDLYQAKVEAVVQAVKKLSVQSAPTIIPASSATGQGLAEIVTACYGYFTVQE